MRGVHTFINDIRRQVFTEVARMAFEGGNYAKTIRELPYKIIPGEVAKYRQNILVERAVVSERIRLAIGLPLRDVSEYEPTDAYLEESVVAEKYYDPPLINIISFACNACPTKRVQVTNMCQGCLAHPCKEVCPKDAISIVQGKSHIDQEKCIKCGKCADECPYGAILKIERPCAEACGMDAIGSDELGRAKIDYDKQVCLLRHVSGELPLRRHLRQEPDLPADPGHQAGGQGGGRRGPRLRQPVWGEGHLLPDAGGHAPGGLPQGHRGGGGRRHVHCRGG